MRSEWMTFRQRRVAEIVCRIAAHPKPFHDGSRTAIRRRGIRYDLLKRGSLKSVAKRQMGRLGCIAAAPMFEGQTPTDLHTWREMGDEPWDGQSGEADKRCHTWDLDRPQAKSVFTEMLLDAIDHRVALNPTQAAAEEFHNPCIRIHCGKRFPILVTPLTKADAATGQCHKGAHRCVRLWLKAGTGESASTASICACLTNVRFSSVRGAEATCGKARIGPGAVISPFHLVASMM